MKKDTLDMLNKILGIASAFYFGWKLGVKEQTKVSTGQQQPFMIDVGGQQVRVPEPIGRVVGQNRKIV